ncbi:PA3496 family putative envelope integrity protein [Pseudoalteromonas luteoviolacea]|uniref:Uncharacterized protein n=1 Tax=Pseudoalteromonas luteoviolacea DSM 6061 TaxID=1365250 RepID=A0A166XF87_9GAMM|nr:hypothetical protein [Pseudoalteromonas luteoviolacea]KZN40256.1 hypothetical protein N475_12375 [Pseudoalteromonas luteoviolacea DSM 6061]KZN57231.1 hypothetical protein N474_08500 [Pseudoalteromonas luteoviolacea CPMOR-2]MBE0387964.1 hypothetical protein [Pseudoalteromonas luteoviolacea DSM 6061]TQF72674.1 hypothetical protein FLM44_17175 [Pseudoalteromonas luteoviolacea]
MGKTYSYDPLDEEYQDEFGSLSEKDTNRQRQKVRKKLDDYLEQKRLRRNLGEDDFDYFDD